MPRHLTTKQAARLLNVTPLTVWRWVKSGKLPDRRIPGTRKLVFLLSDLTRTPDQIAA